jgi:autotransporter-associated beta strand protein
LNSYNETVGSISGAGNISLGSAALTAGGDNSSTALSGVISGTGSLTKAGTGTLTLSGANAYTGTTTVGAGTLRSGAAGVISDGSAVSVSGGATWDLNSYNETVGSISGAGNISLGSAALTAGGDNSSTAVSGVISGTGSLTKAGTGTLTLSGANTYTGATTINGGTLSIAAASGIGSGNVVLGGGTLEATGDVNLAARAVTTTADSTMSAAATKTISGGIFNASGHILTLAGGGNFTLTNTGNDFGAVTVTNGKNVTLIDANALTLSEVNSTGAIDIATLTGNLTLAGAINTTDASANAINLNAGKNAAAGAAAGGNIIVNGGSVSVGAGGIAALYSGSVAGSTGLTALIGEGSGRFRYNSDEATTNYTTPLGSGINAIYRERPIVKVTANNDGKIYDGIAYRGGAGATYSGFVNGDNSAGLGGSLAYGGSSQGAVNAQTYNISPSGLTSGLGYELTYIDGRLTITPAALTVTASNAAKTYGQTVAFNGSEFTSSGLKNGETIGSVSLTSGGAAATAGVSGSPYAITPSAAAGGSFNAGNYAITYANGRLTVNPAALTVTANNGTKTYGNTLTFNGTEFTSSGLQNGETIGGVSLTSGGAAATAGVTGSPYAITPSNATGGSFNAGNYTIAYVNGHLTVVPPTLSACVANPTAPGCTAVLPNPATVANQTSFINALIGAGSSLPPALPPVIAPPPQLLIEIVSEPVEPSIAQAPVSPPPETATTPPPSEPAVAALPAAPEPAAGAPPSVVASGVPAGEGTTPEPAKPAPAEPPAADGPTAPSESTAPAAPPAVAAAPSTEPGAPAAEPAPAPGPAATAAEGFSPSALASGSIDAASLSAMSPEFQSVLSNALARGLSPAEAVQRASNAAAESAAAARADNSPAASLASGSFATSSPIADSPEYQAALSSLLARGVSPAEAMRRAESATAESAAAARADSSPAALLASGSFATSPSAASPAFQAALSSLLARGVSPAEAMRRAESAAAESAAAARADGSPAALLASGSFATSPSAASPAFQAALSSLLARGLSPAEAMQRAESAAAESAAAVLADAKNPLAVLAAGNVAVLEKFPPSGDFSKALAAAMAQGIPMDIAMNRAMQAEALEQQAIRADAASPLAGLSSGKSSLPVGNSDFDQALAGAIGRGASPAEAVAAAKQTLARMPADVQTPSTALATGRNVDEILGAVGASPTFERALGNALARGMTIDAAVVYAKRVESTTALRLPLPPDLAKQVPSAAGSVTVTTVSGKPLPGWIRYDAPSRSFIVYDAPSGALPMEVAITVKGKRTVLRISENMGGR